MNGHKDKLARFGVFVGALAAGALASSRAEAREILVCHNDWARCMALEALTPASFQGRTVRMDEDQRTGAVELFGPDARADEGEDGRPKRDYYFVESGYFSRDEAGVSFRPAWVDADGRLCTAERGADLCTYLVRLTSDVFGAGATNALCFANVSEGSGAATLAQCARAEWGGDHFNLRARSLIANLFGRGGDDGETVPTTPEAPQASASGGSDTNMCAFTPRRDGGYGLDCSARTAALVAPAAVSASGYAYAYAEPAPAAPPARTGAAVMTEARCAYTARADGGYALDCGEQREGARPAEPAPRAPAATYGPASAEPAPYEPAPAYAPAPALSYGPAPAASGYASSPAASPAPAPHEGCAYDARADGGYELSCTVSPLVNEARDERRFGFLSTLRLGSDAEAAPPRASAGAARSCAYEARDGAYFLVCH